MSIKVLIVEDDANWRLLYRLLLHNDKEIEIIGEFDRAEEALEKIRDLRPDVAVVDYSLPGMTGAEFTERLKEYPAIKVIIVSAHEPEYVHGLLNHRVNVVNKVYSEKLLESIKAVCAK